MILDERAEFCDAEAITGMGAATTLIGSQIDLGTVARDMGQGRQVFIQFSVDTAFSGGTSNQFILASDSSAAITTNGTETRHYLSDIFPTSTMIAGFTWGFALPFGGVSGTGTYEQFLGILNVDVGTQTTGKINAFLTFDPHGWAAYPDASN